MGRTSQEEDWEYNPWGEKVRVKKKKTSSKKAIKLKYSGGYPILDSGSPRKGVSKTKRKPSKKTKGTALKFNCFICSMENKSTFPPYSVKISILHSKLDLLKSRCVFLTH